MAVIMPGGECGIGRACLSQTGYCGSLGGRVVLGIRPEDVSIVPQTIGKVSRVRFMLWSRWGRGDLVEISIGEEKIHALGDREKNYNIGDHVRLKFDPEKSTSILKQRTPCCGNDP